MSMTLFAVVAALGLILWLISRSGRARESGPEEEAATQDASRSDASDRGLEWSGNPTGPFKIKQLTRQQESCLLDLTSGDPVIARSAGGFTFQGREVWLYNGRTLASLVKHGFVQESSGRYTITDHGLHAYQALPRRY